MIMRRQRPKDHGHSRFDGGHGHNDQEGDHGHDGHGHVHGHDGHDGHDHGHDGHSHGHDPYDAVGALHWDRSRHEMQEYTVCEKGGKSSRREL